MREHGQPLAVVLHVTPVVVRLHLLPHRHPLRQDEQQFPGRECPTVDDDDDTPQIVSTREEPDVVRQVDGHQTPRV